MIEGGAYGALQATIARLTAELADSQAHAGAAEAECERLREELLAMKRRSLMQVVA